MSRLILFAFLLQASALLAQTDGLTYQAVIIDPNPQEVPGNDISGNVLSGGDVWMRFSIYHGNQTEYQELHFTTTDDYGLVNLVIGSGEPTNMGILDWEEIDWDGTPRQLGVEIAFSEGEYEDFGEEELYFIPYAYHRNITATGTLQVTLEAQFDSNVNIDGTLNVEQDATFGQNLSVEDDATVGGNGYIDGSLEVNQNLDVGADAAIGDDLSVGDDATIDGDLEVEGNGWFSDQCTVYGQHLVGGDTYLNGNSFMTGQVTITTDVSGSDDNWDHYPLRVNGSNQGIAVRLNGAADEDKNYLLFQDFWGNNHGRIEGQTLWQLASSWRYIFDIATLGIQSGLAFAEAGACALNVPPDAAEIVSNNVLGGTIAAQGVEYIFNYNLSIGVTYLSGSADYAEYLERMNPNDAFYPGQVVGVFAGKISHETQGADHLLIISTNPAVLGNMPEAGTEHLYEKVAFLGQVPVRVAGAVREGDYIVASGNNDGFAIAVAPQNLPTEQFKNIIGISWESAANSISNTVNVAIGLNANDLAHRVADLESRLDRLEAQLAGEPVAERPAAEPQTAPDLNAAMKPYLQAVPKTLTASDEEWLQLVSPYIEQEMAKAREHLKALGSDYQRFPELALLIDEPAEALRQMQTGELMPSMWESMQKSRR